MPTKQKRAHDPCLTSNSIEWYTPDHVLDVARLVLGGIDLDPATCEAAQARVQAGRYYTEADNGLARPWHGRVWCNPPYGRKVIDRWVARFANAWDCGEMAAGLLLVPARVDTQWWQCVAHLPWCAWEGRLRFVEPSEGEGTPPPGATFASALIYAGPDVDRFVRFAGAKGRIYGQLAATRLSQSAIPLWSGREAA